MTNRARALINLHPSETSQEMQYLFARAVTGAVVFVGLVVT